MHQHYHSFFDGGLLGLIVNRLLAIILTVLTFGICYPWALVMMKRWECQHTVIEGHRLGFNGSGLQLFGNWIKWWLLSIITFGIYSFWLGIKVRQWTTKHTYFIN